jgi:hypothetical protein
MCIACVNIYVYCVFKDLCALCLGFLSERTIKVIIIMCQDSLSQTCRKKRKKYWLGVWKQAAAARVQVSGA